MLYFLRKMRRRILNIYHIVASNKYTGVAEPVLDVCLKQRELGHTVYFGCQADQSKPLSLEVMAKKRGLMPDTSLRLNRKLALIDPLYDISRLQANLRRWNIDVVHCHSSTDHTIAALALTRNNLPCILIRSNHRSKPLRIDPISKRINAQLTDGIIEVAETTRQLDLKRLSMANDRIITVPGAVKLQEYNPGMSADDIRSEFLRDGEDILIGYPARLVKKRQHLVLLEAFQLVSNRAPNARLLLIGRGPLEKKLRRLLEKKGIENKTAITGFRDDYPFLIAALDIGIYIAEGSDGTCRALLQMMACGKPTVGCNLGAIPEIIEHNKSGLIADYQSHQQLAEHIVALINDNGLRKSLGKAAHQRIKEHFSEQNRTEPIIEFYYRIIQEKGII